MTKNIDTLFIIGPTASGKSVLAMQLAEELHAEIICADSQTIRRELNIGTAKPSAKDQARVRHHLIDIIDPYEKYSAAQFKTAAEGALADIHKRGKLAIVVGGTGLYVDALFYNYTFDKVADAPLRLELMEKSVEELQAAIKEKGYEMPLNDRNPRHLIRTLESGGMKAQDRIPRVGSMIIGLNPGRDTVRRNIARRVHMIFNEGFMEEVQALVAKHGQPSRQLDAIAYRIAGEFQETPDANNVPLIKQAIVTAEQQFAKRQMSWFKRNESITWFESHPAAHEFVLKSIKD
jgi:tRNA dimethylallyltransferase